MPVKILMPALSPTMTEGTLALWKKKEGDKVKAGDVIAEIETDKATMEVEAVDEGTLAKITVPQGTENVAVNTLIAVLLEEGEDLKTVDDFIAKNSRVAPKAAAATPAVQKTETPAKAGVSSPPQALASARATNNFSSSPGSKRIFVSPLAKRLANESRIDLSQVTGTGPNGRILKADIDKAISAGGVTPRATAQTNAPAASSPDAKKLADLLGIKYREEKVTPVRKVIAQRLTESKQTVPHFYLTVAVNLDNLLKARAELNKKAGDKYKASVNDFIIKASAHALKKVPLANASWNGNSILYYETADISVAVATPTGLITPIVKDADNKSLEQISKEMKDLATRARDGKLKPIEFQGGTFSVSNLGMLGIKEFSAIINPPQGCILAVGAGEATPIVMDGEIKIATIMHTTLSVDHRVIDGAIGAEYMAALKELLEKPDSWVA